MPRRRDRARAMSGTADTDAPFDLSLLGRTARVDVSGRCSLGGCDLAGLADRFGTPLFVYDEVELRARAAEYREHFGDGVIYASKAFLNLAMAHLVDEEGLRLDVATGGELEVARAAGFPPERIVFHGNNKSTDELAAALEAGVGRIIVDSTDEIDRLTGLVTGGLPIPAVLLRVTPGVEAHTHEAITTGVDDTKFGLSIATGAAGDAFRRVVDSPALRLVGLHAHIGSQVFAIDAFAKSAHVVVDFVAAMSKETGFLVDELDLGGGLGVRYLSHDDAPTIAGYAATLRRALSDAWSDAGLAGEPVLSVEPGRSIVAPAGLTLYTVGTVKTVDRVRTYVAVDGGMSDNIRTAAYAAEYEAFLPTRAEAPRPLRATVAGKHCEQGDLLVRDARLPADVAVGDVLATPVTGAYGYAMASNYNKMTRPAVIFVRDGEARVVTRRETADDLIRLDTRPER